MRTGVLNENISRSNVGAIQARMYLQRHSSKRSHKREEFLLNIVRQFHREVEAWGLELESQATKDSMCIFAGDWQCSIDMHLEAAKRQEGGE